MGKIFSFKILSVLLTGSVITSISGCADSRLPLEMVKADQMNVATISASESILQVKPTSKVLDISCLAPPPDATFSESAALNIVFGDDTGKSSSGESEMVGRTPTVLLSREVFFRT